MQKIRNIRYLPCPDHVPNFRVLIPKIPMIIKAESDPTLTRTLGILSILGLPEVWKPWWTVYFAPRWKRGENYKRINFLTIPDQSNHCYCTVCRELVQQKVPNIEKCLGNQFFFSLVFLNFKTNLHLSLLYEKRIRIDKKVELDQFDIIILLQFLFFSLSKWIHTFNRISTLNRDYRLNISVGRICSTFPFCWFRNPKFQRILPKLDSRLRYA